MAHEHEKTTVLLSEEHVGAARLMLAKQAAMERPSPPSLLAQQHDSTRQQLQLQQHWLPQPSLGPIQSVAPVALERNSGGGMQQDYAQLFQECQAEQMRFLIPSWTAAGTPALDALSPRTDCESPVPSPVVSPCGSLWPLKEGNADQMEGVKTAMLLKEMLAGGGAGLKKEDVAPAAGGVTKEEEEVAFILHGMHMMY